MTKRKAKSRLSSPHRNLSSVNNNSFWGDNLRAGPAGRFDGDLPAVFVFPF